MRLVSMLTENYVPRARPFLQSLRHLTDAERPSIICLGFNPGNPGTSRYNCYHMPRHPSESSLGILQHGRWLDALPDARDEEVYLLTDADLVIQRDFTPEERQRFEACGENSFLVGWNAHEGDTLGEEGQRIGFADDGIWGDWQNIPCYNTGVLAMRGRSWNRLRDLYESRCERFYRLTTNRSRGQWLMNFCLHRLGLQAEILPPSVHSHGHFGMPKGVTIRDGIAYYGDTPVLFRHAM